MAKRNLTIQLDEKDLEGARVAAARRGTSISAMVAHQLAELAQHDAEYEAAKTWALDALEQVVPRGGRSWRREDLYKA